MRPGGVSIRFLCIREPAADGSALRYAVGSVVCHGGEKAVAGDNLWAAHSDFANMPAPVLKKIAAAAYERKYQAGEVLFREGDPVTGIFLLRRGRVKVTTVSADGREQLLHLLSPGAVFPRVGLFHSGTYPATAHMDKSGIIGVIGKEAVLELVRTDGDVAVALLGLLEGVVRELQDRIRSMALQDVKARVLQVLLNPRERKMTHQEIAAYIGAARETVTRAIGELRREGLIMSEDVR